MPFGLHWELTAREAIAAEMLRRFPYKAPSIHPDRGAVSMFLAAIGTAWRCYHAGAAAALFDVEAAVRQVGLPLPEELSCELVHLAQRALSGSSMAGGQSRSSPLGRHLASLRKRRRHHVMQRALQDEVEEGLQTLLLRAIGEACAPVDGSSFGQTPRRFAPHAVRRANVERAATLAAAELRENAGIRAMRNTFDEVEAVLADPASWPGCFYLPSADTCRLLGWSELLHPLSDQGASDGPRWLVD